MGIICYTGISIKQHNICVAQKRRVAKRLATPGMSWLSFFWCKYCCKVSYLQLCILKLEFLGYYFFLVSLCDYSTTGLFRPSIDASYFWSILICWSHTYIAAWRNHVYLVMNRDPPAKISHRNFWWWTFFKDSCFLFLCHFIIRMANRGLWIHTQTRKMGHVMFEIVTKESCWSLM